MRSILVSPTSEDADKRKKPSLVLRPAFMPSNAPVRTPWWEVPYNHVTACPRDTVITLGNTILEASMSFRCRQFENFAYRDICMDLWRRDKRVQLKAGPRPSCRDSMYDSDFVHNHTHDEKNALFNEKYAGSLNDSEIAFDAADMMRIGKDVFIRKG